MKKRIISIVLVMLLTVSILSMTVSAAVTITSPETFNKNGTVQITGTATNMVKVEVKSSVDNTVWIDVVNPVNGTYNSTYTLDPNWVVGDTFDVTVSTSTTDSATQRFVIKSSGHIAPATYSGGSTTTTPTATPSAAPSASPTVAPSASPDASPSTEPSSAPEKPKFKDLGTATWAEESINGLVEAGIIKGVTNDTFEPDRSITRAEFAKLIFDTFKFSATESTKEFADVKASDWFNKEVLTMAQLGIIQGYEGGTFMPDKEITREEMCVILYRACTIAKVELPTGDVNFVDSSDMGSWASDAIAAFAKLGIVNGVGDNKFAPKNNATRAQAAKIDWLVFQKLGSN